MASNNGFKTMDDFDFNGKTVILRVDLNSSLDARGIVGDSPRFAAYGKTVRELALKGAKVVVLSHQGRPGANEFISLEQHAPLLSRRAKKPVKFVPDIFGPEALKKIERLPAGKILLLENIRFLAEESLERSAEEHSQSFLVRKLAPLADAFVNDAYSDSHRSHASIVGFTRVLPSFAGRVLEKEYLAAQKLSVNLEKPCFYVLGGVKPEEVVQLMESGLKAGADKIFVAGVPALLCLAAKAGQPSSEFAIIIAENKWEKQLEAVKSLVQNHAQKIVLPVDFAFLKDGARVEVDAEDFKPETLAIDLGDKTASAWSKELKSAKTILLKGCVGKVEVPELAFGSQKILRAAAGSKAFVVLSGGSYSEFASKIGLLKRIEKKGHVSLAGGAFITQLRGVPLPGVEALKNAVSTKQFKKEK